MFSPKRLLRPFACCLAVAPAIAEPAATVLKVEHFDRDPQWESLNNRVAVAKPNLVVQDFGYSATQIASAAAGEIGGAIQRSTRPASYGLALTPARTLHDRLSASGTFAITRATPGAGLFFGFFNSSQPGASGRPIGSLGFNFDFEGSGGRLAVRLITGANRSCGTFITPYLPGKFRPTPLRADGTRYRWQLDYDPAAAAGNGRFTFTMHSDAQRVQDYGPLDVAAAAEAKARFPETTTFAVDLPPGYKSDATAFDRFGFHNMMKAGGAATIHFGGLTLDGAALDLSHDPQWTGAGNRERYEDHELTGAHDFGFSATSHAGGKPGEVGGMFWRSGRFAFYADRIAPVKLGQRLEARGRVRMLTAGPDSDMRIGWFGDFGVKEAPHEPKEFIGIHVGGPTRVGHYFLPLCAAGGVLLGRAESAPLLTPGKEFEWAVTFDPTANAGKGELRATLGGETVTLPPRKRPPADAELTHFGLMTTTAGGQAVKVYVDDLAYSVGAGR